MMPTSFYERRKEAKPIEINKRTTTERRHQKKDVSPEQRRLASHTRRYERASFKIPVCLKINDKEVSGYTYDISQEGLLVFCDTGLRPGTPMALQFAFGENLCSLNVSGQVLFRRSAMKERSPQQAIFIKFSGIRQIEQKILASAVQDFKQNPETHKKSLLSILVSADTLAQEAAEFSIQIPKVSTLRKNFLTTSPLQPPASERRTSPRIGANLPVRLLTDNTKGNILNISETGFCLAYEKPTLSSVVSLSVNLSPQEPIEISAEILRYKDSVGNQFHFGARYSAVNKDHSSKIKTFIFDCYAKKASSVVKDNDEDMKVKIEDFFNKDIKQYHDQLAVLISESQGPMSKTEEIEKKVTALTDNLLLKGDALEKNISNDMYMKKVKQEFRELSGCWVYKSPIMKMGYEKPRGYPGDYRLFEVIYDDKPLSEERIGFYFDKYFLNNTYTKAVRSRKDKMKALLKEFIESRGSSRVKLLNVACGGSKEIRELFSEPFIFGREMVFTGLDNDERAIDLSRALLNYLPPNVETRFFKENVLNLFRNEEYNSILGKQDIIYILGLTEYLPDRIFKKLIFFLFQLLNDKGKLIITYKDKNIPAPGIPPDWLCDWAFIKRSEDDLINAAKVLGPDNYSLKIEREGTGCIMFLILTKT